MRGRSAGGQGSRPTPSDRSSCRRSGPRVRSASRAVWDRGIAARASRARCSRLSSTAASRAVTSLGRRASTSPPPVLGTHGTREHDEQRAGQIAVRLADDPRSVIGPVLLNVPATSGLASAQPGRETTVR